MIFGLLRWFCWDLYFNKNFFFTRRGWCGLFVSGVYFFVFVFSLLSFYRYDPMKSCLFLVARVLRLSFVFDYSRRLWFSYFVCMLFLRGIFVILVYFSRMSKFYYFAFSFFELFLVLFVSLLSVVFFCWRFFVFEGLGVFYCGFYFFHFVFLLFSLVLFLLFVSYFLSFTGALRGF